MPLNVFCFHFLFSSFGKTSKYMVNNPFVFPVYHLQRNPFYLIFFRFVLWEFLKSVYPVFLFVFITFGRFQCDFHLSNGFIFIYWD